MDRKGLIDFSTSKIKLVIFTLVKNDEMTRHTFKRLAFIELKILFSYQEGKCMIDWLMLNMFNIYKYWTLINVEMFQMFEKF